MCITWMVCQLVMLGTAARRVSPFCFLVIAKKCLRLLPICSGDNHEQ